MLSVMSKWWASAISLRRLSTEAPVAPFGVTLVIMDRKFRSIYLCEADGVPRRLSSLAPGHNQYKYTLLTGKGADKQIV